MPSPCCQNIPKQIYSPLFTAPRNHCAESSNIQHPTPNLKVNAAQTAPDAKSAMEALQIKGMS
jgi:hypothetical protein